MNKISTVRFLAIVVALFLGSSFLKAQTSLDTNRFWKVTSMSHIRTTGNISNVSFLDGRLYFSNAGVLFSAPSRDGVLGNADVDTVLMAIDPDMTYVVRHPVSKHLYFTKLNKKGRSQLFEYFVDSKGRKKIVKVKIENYAAPIVHPTFNSDGTIMVFSSNNELGFGGYDLFWCKKTETGWSMPENLGRNINAESNEYSPVINGDYLYFSSNRHNIGTNDYDIFATRLVSLSNVSGDTVTAFPIGRSKIQRLPSPINSSLNDFGMAFDSRSNTCYFVTRPDTTANDMVFGMQGPMNCVLYKGRVERSEGEQNGIPGARIQVSWVENPHHVLFNCVTDHNGCYNLILPPDRTFLVTTSARNFLSVAETVTVRPSTTELLLSSSEYTTSLVDFEMKRRYPFMADVLFGTEEGSEITEDGGQNLDALARYMRENAHLKLNIITVFGKRADDNYCHMLNQSRIQSLYYYMAIHGVPADRLDARNVVGTYRPQSEQPIVFDNVVLMEFVEE